MFKHEILSEFKIQKDSVSAAKAAAILGSLEPINHKAGLNYGGIINEQENRLKIQTKEQAQAQVEESNRHLKVVANVD